LETEGESFNLYHIFQNNSFLLSSAVPQAAEFLDAQPLAKGKTEKNKKKKESKVGPQVPESGFMTVPAPQLNLGSNGISPVGSTSASPAPKAGFSRISSAIVEPSSQNGTPVPGDRVKVAFGLGKRKAGDEPQGSPPPKRR
jgi:U4/U6.U5 tri-snRNP-associated protein 1